VAYTRSSDAICDFDRCANWTISDALPDAARSLYRAPSRPCPREYLDTLGLTPKNLTTIIKADGALDAQQKVEALGRLYGLTPKEVKTFIIQANMAKSQNDIDALAKKYHLTPKEVTTLITAADRASSVIGQVRIELDGLNGRVAHTYVVTTHRDVRVGGSSGIAANPTLNENGGFYSGGVRRFADGGWGMDGTYYPRSPQIVGGGANILWGEKATGWEAYISGKPSERDRNLDVLSEAADRLGATVEYANGGITAYASGGVRGSARAREERKLASELSKLTDEIKKSREDRAQYRQSVSQAFVSDPFGGTLGGFDAQMKYEAGKLRGVRADLSTLRASPSWRCPPAGPGR
jgi:hypothetical protein